jgi:hypothetical protein
MPTLEQIHGGSLVPDFSPAINTALKVFGTGRERAKEAEEQRLAGVVSGSQEALRDEERGADPLAGPTPEQQNEALVRLSALNPQAAQVIRGHLERNDRNALKQIALETEQSQKNAVFISGAKDFRGMRDRIMTIVDQKKAAGQSVEGALALLELPEAKLKLEMQSRRTQLTDAKVLLENFTAKEERERVGKLERTAQAASRLLQADVDKQPTMFRDLIQAATDNNNPQVAAQFDRIAGLPRGERNQALQLLVDEAGEGKTTAVAPGQQVLDRFGNVKAEGAPKPIGVANLDLETFTDASRQEFERGGRTRPDLLVRDPLKVAAKNAEKFSAKTRDFGNGTTIQTGTKGTTRVLDPDGNVVPENERRKVIKEANDFEVALIERQQKARGLAKDAVSRAGQAFDDIQQNKGEIQILNQGIALLVEGGAKTGPVHDLMPDFRVATIRLRNIQQRLGLKVIASVTFGALSEKELKIAMATGLPTKLPPKELRKWMVRRREALIKLNNWLEDSALHLSTPGNNIATWTNKQRREQVERKRAAKGRGGDIGGLSTNQLLDDL